MIDFSRFDCPDNSHHSKVVTLQEAISANVKPGMSLHFCVGQTNANAAICEIARQFWGTQPNFTVYSMLFYQHGISLIVGHLVKKLVCAFVGDSYPTGSPNSIIRNAHASGELEIESWSILTYIERFMAGAMGLPFMPTRSLIGSSMAESNKGSFIEIADPFHGDTQIGLVGATRPDISFVHAHAADPYGNLVGIGPGAEGTWGAMASRNGVIATVEKLVSTEFVREHSSLVRIPGYKVKAVVAAPYGSHPRGITNQGSPQLATYYDDFEYLIELRQAYKNDETARQWVDEWMLNCRTHEDYLAKLGPKRLQHLVERARPGAWRQAISTAPEEHILSPSYNQLEMMAVQASREIKRSALQNEYKVILAGVGVSNLAAWLANQMLKEEGYPAEVVAEFGFFGYAPPPGDASIHKIDTLLTATMMTDALEILGIHAAGASNRCIGVLGAAQIDQHGNVNSTIIPGKTHLVGSGGANDVASGSREVVVVMAQNTSRMVETVPFITCPGGKIRTLVTDMGVFQKLRGADTFSLTKVLPTNDGASLPQLIGRIRENCGWPLTVSSEIEVCDPPEIDSLSTIRLFDPNGYFIGK